MAPGHAKGKAQVHPHHALGFAQLHLLALGLFHTGAARVRAIF